MLQLSLFRVATLLFGSGCCALVYQMVWFRELRLVFGSSTPANAAVLAIFMGGLGLGSAVLGKRVDRHANPFLLYSHLEIGIAVFAGLSPFLIGLARWLYIALGGASTLGDLGATAARLILSAAVLLVPTFLMGGTLPAAARAVESVHDLSRRRLALVYGLNTFGAVTGTLLATLLLIELFGNRQTLLLAALVNLLIGVVARAIALQPSPDEESSTEATADELQPRPSGTLAPPQRFVLAAAALTGFVFITMELVWYRTLAPLLGGTTYTFGLILAEALLGIAIGGALYSIVIGNKPVTQFAFAVTCLLEAIALAIPLALGDLIAVGALATRPLGALGFWGFTLSWSIIISAVALPAAIISGFQFPLLVALLGQGRHNVGREVGAAYAWNTLGSISGSLLTGFGLMTALGAIGLWRFSVLVLAAL